MGVVLYRKVLRRAGVAAILAVTPGLVAYAQVLDQVTVGVAGTIEAFCFVEDVISADAVGVENFSSALDDTLDVASLGFDFAVVESDDVRSSDIGSISAGTMTVALDMYCNGPFRISIESANGALRNTDVLDNAASFTNALPYSVEMTLPDGATTVLASATGEAGTLISATDLPPQDGDATLRIDFSPPARKLLSGTYNEVLTVTIVQDAAEPPTVFED